MSEKTYAAWRAYDLLLELQSRGFHNATILDIGGGLGATSGLSKDVVDQFDQMVREIATEANGATWQNNAYGLHVRGDRLTGSYSEVDIPTFPVGPDRLRQVLDSQRNGETFARALSDNLVELWVEPGRAMFSSAGVFVASVASVSRRDRETFVTVDAHRNQLCFENGEMIADPILLSRDQTNRESPEACFIVGNLCMENDFITYRKIPFDSTPQIGDAIVWTHTGAYRMHMSQSNAIGQPSSARYRYETGKFFEERL